MPLKFLPHIIIRCPALSYADYQPERLAEMFTAETFRTAIYLSNRQFYRALEKKGFHVSKLADKERLTLQNYYNRMSFRSTPFGAFSSFAITKWADGSSEVIELNLSKLHLLPDQHYLQILPNNRALDEYSRLAANPTLYKQGNTLKFAQTIVEPNATAYKYALQSFDADRTLNGLMKKIGRSVTTFGELAKYITNATGCDEDEAFGYLGYLINSGILNTDNLPPTLVKDNKSLLVNTQPNIDEIERLQNQLAAQLPDEQKAGIKNYFYTNLQSFTTDQLNIAYQQKLARVIETLQILVPFSEATEIRDFATAFAKRYDRQATPLLEALDPVSGMGYGNSSQSSEGLLLDGLNLAKGKKQTPQLSWTVVHRLLLRKMQSMAGSIEITDADLKELEKESAVDYRLPASSAVLFNIADGELIIDTVGGVSANGLIGRFTLFDDDILQAAKAVAQTEQLNNPEIIFAEINHLADSHTDNINRRLPVYDHEILINTLPTPGLRQIALNDLYLLVQKGELILYSKTLRKRVIPRFTSAHNHQRNDLNIFRFLADLQYQKLRYDLDFNLEKFFPGLDHYPRVSYNGTIISLASWVIPENVTISLNSADLSKNIASLRKHLKDNYIPLTIAFGAADKQLYFDLSDDAQAGLFLENIRSLKKVTIKEFILPKTTAVKQDGKYLINQFVGFLANTETTYPAVSDVNIHTVKTTRDFPPGSEWLYLNIYCSPLAADELLAKTIAPLMQRLVKNGVATQWFFIRYYDNGPHIRLRINCGKTSPGNVLTSIEPALTKSTVVSEFGVATYQRELVRYGEDIIEDVEALFCKSSVAVSAYLMNVVNEGNPYPHYAYGLMSALGLVRIFLPGFSDQVDFTENVAANFLNEYSGIKELKFNLDKKYRELSPQISALTTDGSFFKTLKVARQQKMMEAAFTALLQKLNSAPAERKKQLVADIIHMHINRVFADKQRDHEMVIYYCLSKKLRSELARQKV